jgi:hypothetical protein
MIDDSNPMPELKNLFRRFLKLKYGAVIDNAMIPLALRELYQIREAYSSIKKKHTP